MEIKAKIVKVFPGLIILKREDNNLNIVAEPKRDQEYKIDDVFILGDTYVIGKSEYHELISKIESSTPLQTVEKEYFFKNQNEIENFINYYFYCFNNIIEFHTDDELEDIDNIEIIYNFFKTLKFTLNTNNLLSENDIIQSAKILIDNEIVEVKSIRGYLEEVEDIITNFNENITQKYDIGWNSWRIADVQMYYSGYNEEDFIISKIGKNSILQQHYYTRPPKKIEIECIKINQKGFEFYIGKMEVRMIAQSALVPSLEKDISVFESAKRVLNSEYKMNEWQRQADLRRIARIHSFIDDSNNVIANSPMLYVNDNRAAYFENNKLVIDFEKFLIEIKDEEFGEVYTDFKDYNLAGDLKPLWLIDGQHRVLGIHRSERYNRIEVPVIIFPNEFSVGNTAKVFAEINTFQVKLSPLHEIYMQHRFKLGHVKSNRRFNDIWNSTIADAAEGHWRRDWEDSRANHFAYEMCAEIATRDNLRDRIQIINENSDVKNRIINAEQFINYTRKYFLASPYDLAKEEQLINGPEGISRKEVLQLYIDEVSAYLDAFAALYRADNWSDNNSRWSPRMGNRRPLITKETFFQILLELYPLVYRLARQYQLSIDAESEELCLELKHFYKVLRPIKNVDWLDVGLNDVYKGGGERQRRCLEVWLADALLSCEGEPSMVDILDENKKSIAGCGITASLAPPVIHLIHDGLLNRAGDFDVSVERPINARYEGRYFIYSNNIEFKSGVIKHDKYLQNHRKRLFISAKEFKDKTNLKIAIQYVNISNVMTGRIEESL